MSSSSPWPTRPYTPRHKTFPYTPSDFLRQDPSPDTSFYSAPRFVTHIDVAAIETLKAYYANELPQAPGTRILDVCSSWVSHFPEPLEKAVDKGQVSVVGVGMNRRELERNGMLNGGRVVGDLNQKPDVGEVLREAGVSVSCGDEKEGFDAVTNVVSTDYLIHPVAVLESLRGIVKPGGRVHLVISNRCFPTKVIRRWLEVGEEERVLMVGDFLYFAGWEGIEIVELSDGVVRDGGGGAEGRGDEGLKGFMRMMGMGSGRRDPLWVVRARNGG
ncbi:hypothetical protein CERZMDRAFT_115647 [Cercospora zeae-maydis SCOH1-5]|uniref:Methyltransferase type 11 domain-containing protein n=1 Tax=Cercospora zeae-maydis SCOH1-5 TaxID=717836 RepID=A0A6A6F070_9PEZI|nr:hypothetical protein CERZMDRAFT_115647 [Cercospora zeae-maydis SCOH1-5]